MRNGMIFNVISIIFVLMGLAVMLFVGITVTAPPPPTPVVELPTVVPTFTPSDTPTVTNTATFPPTFTSTPTPTATLTATNTPTLTPTISNTPGPTFTASQTFTPSITPTLTATPTPTGPTNTPQPSPNPFPYGQQDATRFTPNNANSLGCSWQGIGGQIFNSQGSEIIPGLVQIRVYGTGFESVTQPGTNSIYGPTSGWEIRVADNINTNTYFVRLESLSTGTPISPEVQVTFPARCDANTAIVNFRATR